MGNLPIPKGASVHKKFTDASGINYTSYKVGSTYVVVNESTKSVTYHDKNMKTIDMSKVSGDYNDKTKSAYDQNLINELEKAGISVNIPDFDSKYAMDVVPGNQHKLKSGIYGNEFIDTPGFDENFIGRFPEFIKQNPNFNKHSEVDVEKFQKWYNVNIDKQLIDAGITDQNERKKYISSFGFTDEQGQPNSIDKQFGTWTGTRLPVSFKKAEKAPPPPATTTPPPPSDNTYKGPVPDPLKQAPIKRSDLWYLPDINNFVGAVTDKVNRYKPALGQIDAITPGYVTEDPTRKLAANQEQMARYQNQIENTVDGNVGLGAMLGSSGEGFQNAANAIAGTESNNVAIVNNAYQQNAAIRNQQNMINAGNLQKYIGENAALNENYDRQMNDKKWREIAAFNQGWGNHVKKLGFEEVLDPQRYQDPITGHNFFSGVGKNPFEPDLSGSGLQYNPEDAWNKYYKEAQTNGDKDPAQYATSKMGVIHGKQTKTAPVQGRPYGEYGGSIDFGAIYNFEN